MLRREIRGIQIQWDSYESSFLNDPVIDECHSLFLVSFFFFPRVPLAFYLALATRGEVIT